MKKIGESALNEIALEAEGMSLDAIWIQMIDFEVDFHERKIIFFDVLVRLIEKGWIKFYQGDDFLDSPVEQQVKILSDSFPKDETDYPDYPRMEFFMWFVLDCPLQIAWKRDGRWMLG